MDTAQLQQLEETLVFSAFTNQDALNLGMELISLAKENGVNIAVHVERNRVPLFTHLMDGTSEENVYWLYRKKRVVDHYNRSTQYIAARFEENGLNHDEHSLLSPAEYQAIGGSLPIRVEGAGVIGSVTVAGLTPELDHQYAVEGVTRFLERLK
ncbi:heme-degrading domain-containing protein [Bacillus mangrovi]|uniref:Heme-degrading domain-containing protein n=1 Tax=Metabacillus mangrovi TaxID=1491830 RepID=A0A7X2S7X8_9BACI|nr:heme-degrading domain-containing protein [Metabacillus mangrovi]MTH55292.1 heme-degrading domain-containing protein [Metabacillus mangrovi]